MQKIFELEFIYNSSWKNLIFTGGSCLRFCYDLNRLSEDLDFDFFKKNFSQRPETEKLSSALAGFFKTNYNFRNLDISKKKERIYLKFPVLQKLGLASLQESNKLYLKIEFPRKPSLSGKIVFHTITRRQFVILLKAYDLSSLMAGKINAILKRVWFKGKGDVIDIKGRDFFDLIWFLERSVLPNWKRIDKDLGIKTTSSLFFRLEEKIKKMVTPQKLEYDLINLIENQKFVKNFCQNYFKIFTNYKNIYLKKY